MTAAARVGLVLGPTPLHPLPALSAELGVPVLAKRDDLTGAGLGGNKLRNLEFLIADALAEGCDSLVTGAGPQSNWTMLAALAARRHGLDPHVVVYGDGAADEGNMRLHRWLGTDIRFTGQPERSSVDDGIDAVAAELRAAGRRPYLVPRGGATPLGALGYVRGYAELTAQLSALGVRPEALWLATGSCGTQAGLVAGAALARAAGTGGDFAIRGVTVSRPATECRDRIAAIGAGAAALAARLGVGSGDGWAAAGTGTGGPEVSEPEVIDGWIGPGYGKPSADGQRAARLVAATEGIFLDPVFGAKAMAALLAAGRAGQLTGPQVFLVS
ncbi:MAG: pyridoxal-phosphate dependent enzyme, partial [Actinomycetota bacterium]|nr:pyridoxal-phosphate dependent enzyme [Actinomycetota bacterium]